jgi:hypothetical protein
VNTPLALHFIATTEVTNSSLSAPAGVTLDFAVATLLQNVNLMATGGGAILFPVATAYTGYDYGDTTIQASGAGSRIDLSHLETFEGGGEFVDGRGYWYYYTTVVTALDGGRVDLSGAFSHRNSITVEGANSALGVAGITRLGDTTLAVNTPLALHFIATTEVTNSSLSAPAGVTLDFAVATTLQNVNLMATGGGAILFPVATAYTGYDYGDTTIQASGAGSRIDLSHLETFEGGGEFVDGRGYWYYYTTVVTALDGGRVDLSGAFSHRNSITVEGANSALGVAGITRLGDTTLAVNTPLALHFIATTEVTNSSLSAPAGVTLDFAVATTLQNVNLMATGGGAILFPVATAYTGYDYGDTTIQASGAGSRIDLSHLETFEGGGEFVDGRGYWYYYTTVVTALDGGRVDLSGAFSHRNSITVEGANSALGVAGITRLGDTTLAVNTPLALHFIATTEVTNSSLSAPAGVTLDFAVATTLQNVNLMATGGGAILFPVATAYTGYDYGDTTIQASGAGSRIDLSHLETFEGGGEFVDGRGYWYYYTTVVTALDGGRVDLSGAFSHRNSITVEGANSALGVAGITRLGDTTLAVNTPLALHFIATTEVTNSSLSAPAGVTLDFAVATTLQNVNLMATGGGAILFPVATAYTGYDYGDTTIQASGAGSRIDLSHLETFEGGGEFVDGRGYWYYYTTVVTALDGGRVDLSGAFSHRNSITVEGANSALGVAGITRLGDTTLAVNTPLALHFIATTEVTNSSLSAPAGVTLDFAVATTLQNVNLMATGGGAILFPVATAYTGYDYGDTTIQASGAGSRIDLSHLETFEGGGEFVDGRGYWYYYTTVVTALDGGRVDLSGAFSHRNSITVEGANSALGVAGITQLGDTTLAVNTPLALRFIAATEVTNSSLSAPAGVTLDFAVATTLQNVNLMATGGGKILFPVATSFQSASTGNVLQASGAESKVDLSSLNHFSGGSSGATQLEALAGGHIALSGDVEGATVWNLDGTGGTFDVSGVTSLADATVTVTNGAVLDFSVASVVARASFSATGGGQILFPVATAYTGYDYGDTTIQASGGGSRIDLSHLATFEGGGEYDGGFFGGGWHYYTTVVNALDGGRVDLSGAFSHRNSITVEGANSALGVERITQLGDTTLAVNTPLALHFIATTEVTNSSLSASAGVTLDFAATTTLQNVNLMATGGGTMLFPVATAYTGYDYGDTTIQASGGSRIDLSHLATFEGGGEYDGGFFGGGWHYYTTVVNALDGGRVDLSGAFSHRNSITVEGANSMLGVAGVSSISDTAFTASNGAIWTFPVGWHVTWGSGNTLTTTGTGSQFINRSSLNISGAWLAIDTSNLINEGVLNSQTDGVFDFNGSFRVDQLGILTGVTGGSFTISGDLLGDTRNADQYAPQAMVLFDGSGNSR